MRPRSATRNELRVPAPDPQAIRVRHHRADDSSPAGTILDAAVEPYLLPLIGKIVRRLPAHQEWAQSRSAAKRTLRLGSWFGMLGRVVSAQDEFRGFLRDMVSPGVRRAGLKGPAGRYHIPSLCCCALVGFQRSEWSTASAVQFTVNLKVVSREVWKLARADKPWLPETPAPNARYPVAEWSARIGSLMPGRQDHWWGLRPGQPLGPLAAEVIGALTDYGLPALRRAFRQAC